MVPRLIHWVRKRPGYKCKALTEAGCLAVAVVLGSSHLDGKQPEVAWYLEHSANLEHQKLAAILH